MALKDLICSLRTIGIEKTGIYRVDDFGEINVYLFFNEPLDPRPLISRFQQFIEEIGLSSDVHVAAFDEPLMIPLQTHFSWLSERGTVIVAKRDIACQAAISMFCADAQKGYIDLEQLETRLPIVDTSDSDEVESPSLPLSLDDDVTIDFSAEDELSAHVSVASELDSADAGVEDGTEALILYQVATCSETIEVDSAAEREFEIEPSSGLPQYEEETLSIQEQAQELLQSLGRSVEMIIEDVIEDVIDEPLSASYDFLEVSESLETLASSESLELIHVDSAPSVAPSPHKQPELPGFVTAAVKESQRVFDSDSNRQASFEPDCVHASTSLHLDFSPEETEEETLIIEDGVFFAGSPLEIEFDEEISEKEHLESQSTSFTDRDVSLESVETTAEEQEGSPALPEAILPVVPESNAAMEAVIPPVSESQKSSSSSTQGSDTSRRRSDRSGGLTSPSLKSRKKTRGRKKRDKQEPDKKSTGKSETVKAKDPKKSAPRASLKDYIPDDAYRQLPLPFSNLRDLDLPHDRS